MQSRGRIVASLVVGVGVLWAPTRIAQAEDQAVVQKMIDRNKQALAEFDAKNYDAAKQTLIDAIVLGKEAGLQNHQMMARTYVHLGAVFVDGFKDRAKGVRYLVSALKVRADISLTPSLVTSSLTDAFQEAKREAGVADASAGAERTAGRSRRGAPADTAEAPPPYTYRSRRASRRVVDPDAADEEPDLPADIPDPLYCPNPDEAPPSEDILLHCVAQPGLRPARVMLRYRTPDSDIFASVIARRSRKGWYSATIPGSAVEGKSLQYYFEAHDSSNTVVGDTGQSDSPNLLIIRKGAQPVRGTYALAHSGEGGVAGIEENPLAKIEAQKEREALEALMHRRGPRSFIFGFGAGMGYGWHPKKPLEFRNMFDSPAGLRTSKSFHILPEVGYQWSEQVALSVQLRIQFIPSEGGMDPMPGQPAEKAFAALGKVYYFVGERNVQWFMAGMIGGGDFRLYVPPSPPVLPRNDTISGGLGLLGAGLGAIYHITKNISVIAEARPLVGVPNLAAVLDVGASTQLAF